MAQPPNVTGDVVLTCTPEKVGDQIVFSYEVTNRGAGDVYVMDAVVGVDPASRSARLEPDNVTIWYGADGYAHLLKGLAPLPTDRSVTVRVIPVAVRLAAGARLARRISLV